MNWRQKMPEGKYLALSTHPHGGYYLYWSTYLTLMWVNALGIVGSDGSGLAQNLKRDVAKGYTYTTDPKEINKFLMTMELLK